MTEENNLPELGARIAFIIDGVVQDVLNTDERLAAIFLSQPTIVDVSENQENMFITHGWSYDEDSQTFTAPAEEAVTIYPEGSSDDTPTPPNTTP